MKWMVPAVLALLLPVQVWAASLRGVVIDSTGGEALPYSNVVLEGGGLELGALSDVEGAYEVRDIPPGTYSLEVSYIGYTSYRDTLAFEAGEEKRLDVSLALEPILGEQIVIEADPFEEERAVQPGFVALRPERLEELPAVGEPDVLRTLQLLPGVQAASDISSGLYIRGGGPDQTLILLDQVPLYNPSHAFGFFSTFNPDAIEDMSLHKGAYPAQYGGRMGSVLDIRNRDGNPNGFGARGGVSLISARLTMDGPVEKGSWMVSGRRTYLEPILSAIRNDSTDVPVYYFYDLNLKLARQLTGKDDLVVSGYFGRDDLNFDLDAGTYIDIRWGNSAVKGKWTREFSSSLYGHFILAASRYTSTTSVSFFETPVLYRNQVQDVMAQADVDYFADDAHSLKFGVLASRYEFAFQQVFNRDAQLDLLEKPTLFSAYAMDQWRPRSGTNLRLGMRANYFSSGDRFQVEPRVSLGQALRPDLRFKMAGGLYHQYLQLVATEGFSGGDFWVPLDGTVDPGRAWQGVAGLEWDLSRRYQMTVEGYYTGLSNLVALDNRVAVDSESTATEDVFVTGGTGYATGMELFLQRRTGALTGWVGYTLGWTRRKFAELNGGRRFPPKYDRRHDLSVVASYRVGRWVLGANLVYATGQAFTPAAARYRMRSPATQEYLRDDFVLPADRNSARLLPYHRLDLSVKRRFRLFGTGAEAYLQVFNAYNRRNEWFVQYNTGNPQTEPEVVKMLPILPTLGINFEL